MKNRWRYFFILSNPVPRQTTFRFTACCLVTACYCLVTVTVWHVELVQLYITITYYNSVLGYGFSHYGFHYGFYGLPKKNRNYGFAQKTVIR
jgi:hypothetical protein